MVEKNSGGRETGRVTLYAPVSLRHGNNKSSGNLVSGMLTNYEH